MIEPPRTIPLREIAERLGCSAPLVDVPITGMATLEQAGPGELSFLGSDAFLKRFAVTKAAAVLVNRKVKLPPVNHTSVLLVDDADLATAKVLAMFARPPLKLEPGVNASARVHESAKLGNGVRVGAFSLIGRDAEIGPGTIVHPHVYVGDEVVIGANCEIFPNVTIRERITIGSRVIIHAGSVLGTDGFGYRWNGTEHEKIPQIGTVIIEDDVEIGSCVCIDRAKFSATRVGRGTKIDNLVQIAHNVVIGAHCIIVGQAGLAGSATLGAGVVLGGQVAIRDHVTLGDGAMVAACAAVAEDVPPKAIVSGTPALPHRQSLREQAAFRRLPDLVVQVRKLEEQIEKLRELIQPQMP
jgi:UDP-3-O-[3-hydroxymyristoyl] glucosamine N-acyltransferase